MSHVEHDTLWSLARGELSQAEARDAKAHLADCPDCRVSFEDAQTATQLLMDLPEAPPMPEAMVRRVGAELAEAADARAAKRFTSWWQSLFTPRFVFAAALGAVLVVASAWLLAGATPVEPPPVVATPQPTAPAPRKLQVTVASAKKATAAKAQVLAEGARITTQQGGSVWMKLPDGSRAGLTAKSEVTLATLEEKQLTLELARGNLAMVVPHREDRVLTVRAGDVVVKDLGTRFLVSREADRTLVAVEEGEVEVTTPRGTQVVTANRAVSWSGGKLTELPWEPTPAPAKPQPAAVVATPEIPSTPDIPLAPQAAGPAPAEDTASIARLAEEDALSDDAPPPAEENAPPASPDRAPMATDEQWAQLPPPPAPGAGPPPSRAVTATERGFTLRALERKLREFGAAISSPSLREAGVRSISMAADARDCTHALKLADRWLAQPVAPDARELKLRRTVLLQQVRCLNQLGRKDEATALQREIETTR